MRIASKVLFLLKRHLPHQVIYDKFDGEVYLERYYLIRTLFLGIMVHRILKADSDDRLHDHPWKWALSLVLYGEYVEERLKTDRRIDTKRVRRGQANVIRGTTFHRISHTLSNEIWTLFIHGPRVKQWSFLRDTSIKLP